MLVCPVSPCSQAMKSHLVSQIFFRSKMEQRLEQWGIWRVFPTQLLITSKVLEDLLLIRLLQEVDLEDWQSTRSKKWKIDLTRTTSSTLTTASTTCSKPIGREERQAVKIAPQSSVSLCKALNVGRILKC